MLSLKQKHRARDFKQIIAYILVGVWTTFISLAVYYGLTDTIFQPDNPVKLQIANIGSWIAGVTFAYAANRKVVFKSCSKNIIKEMASFYLARVGTLLIEMVEMFIMVTLLNMNDKLAKIIVMFITTMFNYILGRFLIFKN
ncbi:MAG: GtrA family protein [Lachnospiraceae bacterium]|nr:GtrA family protein [Lachnospiraceae bacterium]